MEDMFDCHDSQLSMTFGIGRSNTEGTGMTGYSGRTGASSAYTDYTSDTFRSSVADEKRTPAAQNNTGANRMAAIHELLEVEPAPASPRRKGFHNQSVVMTALPSVADNDNSSHAVLAVQSHFIEDKSRDELKPFAIIEVEVRCLHA